MTITVRADNLGWDVQVGETFRAIIKTEHGQFRLVNGWKLDNGMLDFATFDEAVAAAYNLEV